MVDHGEARQLATLARELVEGDRLDGELAAKLGAAYLDLCDLLLILDGVARMAGYDAKGGEPCEEPPPTPSR